MIYGLKYNSPFKDTHTGRHSCYFMLFPRLKSEVSGYKWTRQCFGRTIQAGENFIWVNPQRPPDGPRRSPKWAFRKTTLETDTKKSGVFWMCFSDSRTWMSLKKILTKFLLGTFFLIYIKIQKTKTFHALAKKIFFFIIGA